MLRAIRSSALTLGIANVVEGRDRMAPRRSYPVTVELATQEGWYKPNEAGGLCMCGCGQPTPLAPKTLRKWGNLKGQPLRYLHGHHARGAKHSPAQIATRVRRGSAHHMWRGGRSVVDRGYVYIKVLPGDPFYGMASKRGYVKEHRLVMAEHLGRALTDEEVVHHENNVHDDNRLENLLLFPNHATHMEHHHAQRRAQRYA